MFAFCVSGFTKPFRDEAVGDGDIVGGMTPPLFQGLPFEALSGS